jgi:hypothetical protein
MKHERPVMKHEGNLILEKDLILDGDLIVKGNILGKDGKRYNIKARSIDAYSISACSIDAYSIDAYSISADSIKYWNFCIALYSMKIKNANSYRSNHILKCLDKEIEWIA